MKMLYEEYNEKTNLFELTIGLESIFAKIMHLDEQFTFNEYLVYKKLKERHFKKILFIPTGALMSTTTAQQGDPIMGIAHCVAIEMGE